MSQLDQLLEKLILTVIDMSRMSKCQCNKSCEYMEIVNIDDNGFCELKIGVQLLKMCKSLYSLCKCFLKRITLPCKGTLCIGEYLNRVPERTI